MASKPNARMLLRVDVEDLARRISETTVHPALRQRFIDALQEWADATGGLCIRCEVVEVEGELPGAAAPAKRRSARKPKNDAPEEN